MTRRRHNFISGLAVSEKSTSISKKYSTISLKSPKHLQIHSSLKQFTEFPQNYTQVHKPSRKISRNTQKFHLINREISNILLNKPKMNKFYQCKKKRYDLRKNHKFFFFQLIEIFHLLDIVLISSTVEFSFSCLISQVSLKREEIVA